MAWDLSLEDSSKKGLVMWVDNRQNINIWSKPWLVNEDGEYATSRKTIKL